MYRIKTFNEVIARIDLLSDEDRGKIVLAFDALEYGYFHTVHTKMVRSPIRELIVKEYRILLCIKNGTVYFLTFFVKKTAKTPKSEIKKAVRLYKQLF